MSVHPAGKRLETCKRQKSIQGGLAATQVSIDKITEIGKKGQLAGFLSQFLDILEWPIRP